MIVSVLRLRFFCAWICPAKLSIRPPKACC
ncbi:hypothetical protein [Acinetobacter sp. WCHAc060033]